MRWNLSIRTVAVAAWWLILTGSASAQSVSPPIAEYREHARSSFRLQNPSIFPITVVLELRGFTVTEAGDVLDLPLDTGRIHVKLSEMSFRIPPRGSRTVFYEATSDSLPVWFNILSAMSGTKTDNGINVRILLPHVVYLNQKQSLQKTEVVVKALEFDAAGRRARIQLENVSPNLGRVLQVSVGDKDHVGQSGSAFPLLPHSHRWTELPWDGTQPPTRVVVRFARFSIDTLLAARAPTFARDTARLSSAP